jgi:hypothetical protein
MSSLALYPALSDYTHPNAGISSQYSVSSSISYRNLLSIKYAVKRKSKSYSEVNKESY